MLLLPLNSYNCFEGFEVQTQNKKDSSTCLPSGDWSVPLPVCSPVRCRNPPVLPNAVSVGDDNYYGSKVCLLFMNIENTELYNRSQLLGITFVKNFH